MSRPKNKEETILLAAADVFMERGFQNASIQDIADKAGIGKGTIYEYFKNKDELFVETAKYCTQKLASEAKIRIMSKNSFMDMLNEAVFFSQDLAQEGTKLVRFMQMGSFFSLNEEAKEKIHRVFMNLRDQFQEVYMMILEKGAEEGKVEDTDLKFAAYMVGEMIAGYIANSLHNEYLKMASTQEQKDREREKLIKMVLYGVAPRQT